MVTVVMADGQQIKVESARTVNTPPGANAIECLDAQQKRIALFMWQKIAGYVVVDD